jgi:hypothetical protein
MVGICTKYKDRWTYTNETIHGHDATGLSKLLSDLVDQAKAGYTFTDEQFQHFKKQYLKKSSVKTPAYMDGRIDRKSKHIIDQLTVAAHDTIETILTEFKISLPSNIPCWDKDLADFATWANSEAATNREWLPITVKLKDDLQKVKDRWAENMGGRSKGMEESKPTFGPMLAEIYRQFQAIQPAGDTPLTRLLLAPWSGRPELSQWAMLRASFLFASYSSFHVSKFVWWMCGIQLCHMKAAKKGITAAVSPEMYAMLRPDSIFVKLRTTENEFQWEALMEGSVGEEDD